MLTLSQVIEDRQFVLFSGDVDLIIFALGAGFQIELQRGNRRSFSTLN